MSGVLQAGIGRADITPPVGIAHAGWGAQLHERAEGVDQAFVVTALALADDDVRCLLIEMDTGLLMIDDADGIRDAVAEAVDVPRSGIRVSYSHTHAGPLLHALNIKAGFELVEPYWSTLRAQTIGAARQAVASLRPARVGAALTTCGIAVNRRFETPGGRVVCSQHRDGFTDPTVTVGRIDAEDGSPIAAIVGYACHPITLAFQNRLLSPDYPGITRSVVEGLTGTTCLFLQGAAGDQMPIEALTGDLTVHRRLGTRLGAAAAEAFLGIDPFERSWAFDRVVESGAPLGLQISAVQPPREGALRVATNMVEMPLRERLDLATTEARRDEMAAELAVMRGADTDAEVLRDAMFRMKRAEMRLWFASMYGGQDTVAIELQGIRVGPLGLVGFPGEPFAASGASVRERSPLAATLLSGYTNGWAGYVPTRSEFPRLGYEVEFGSHFAAGAAETLEDAAVALLKDVA